LKKILIFLLLAGLSSCSFFKKKKMADADAVARVNDEYLYASDIATLTKGYKGNDSIEVLKKYADTWIRKKLLLQKAKENISEDNPAIALKIEDYRETLLLYEYEKALINQKLDTVMRVDELNEWYERLNKDFPLEKDVFLVFFVKLKKEAPDLEQVRKWIKKPEDEESMRKLEGYSKEFASSYALNKGFWFERDIMLKNFPLNEYDLNLLAGSKGFHEFKSDEGSWFMRIGDILKKDQPAPLDFIRDKIERAIIEKRRLMLIEKLYDKIYRDGIKSKSFEVFVK